MRGWILAAMVACGGAEPAKGGVGEAAVAVAPAKEEGGPLRVGDEAPAVTLVLHDGRSVSLAELRGKPVLVYFYPKDDTPGCTVEAQGLRDGWEEIQGAGLQVFGVSTQDASSHQAFVEKHALPFPLVVDVEGAVAAAFRVPLRGGMAARQSFLIGADGRIKATWLQVDPKDHAAEVIAAAKG